MQAKPDALVNNSFHWVAENPQKLDLAPIVLSNVQALLAALPDHSPLRRPILGYLLQGISEHDALRLFRISRSTYWKSLREAGSNTILTSLRYLRKRASKEGTVASGRFGDKPVVCAPTGESDDGEEEFEIPEPADGLQQMQNEAGGALRALAGAVSVVSDRSSTTFSYTRPAPERNAEDAPAEKRARRASIGFLLN